MAPVALPWNDPNYRPPYAPPKGDGYDPYDPSFPVPFIPYPNLNLPDALNCATRWAFKMPAPPECDANPLDNPPVNRNVDPLGGTGKCETYYDVFAVAPAFFNGVEFRISTRCPGPIDGNVFVGEYDNNGDPVYFFRSAGRALSIGSSRDNYRLGVRITRVERMDGLPDNCGTAGNPPGGLTAKDIADIAAELKRQLGDPSTSGVGQNLANDLADSNSKLYDALRRYLDGLLGKPGSGIPGDNDGDGDVDEDDEDKENDDDDEGCSGKSQLAILKATVDKLYKFLGGKDFGGDKCKPGKTGFSINPESYLRSLTADSYDFETANGKVTKITTQEHEVETLPQLIAALLSVNYVRSGQYKFPTTVADTIVQTDQGFLATIFGTKTEVLTDQQSYHQWFLEQFDAILGRWQQKIVIQDSDLEQPGDQEKVIRLPNLAEAISELFVLSFQTKMAADTLLNFNSRLAIESACIKAELFRTQSMVDTLVDYIGAKTKDVKADLPLLFTLTTKDGEQPSEASLRAQNNLSNLLEQSKKPIVLTQLAQKETLQSDLVTFRQAAAIIRAALSKNLGTDGNIAGKLMNIVRAAAKGLEQPPGQSENEDGNADLSTFLQEFEQGFIGSSGISDATNPYGRPINQRPQAREIGRSDEDS
jgi:hypothetical protein